MKLNETEQLFEDFQRTANLLRRYLYAVNQESTGAELLRGQGRILRILLEEAGLSQKELVKKMHIRPASLSELLKKLLDKQLITAKSNEQDRRITNYWLTEFGEKTAKELIQKRRFSGSTAFAILDQAEQEQLRIILKKMIHDLDGKVETNKEN